MGLISALNIIVLCSRMCVCVFSWRLIPNLFFENDFNELNQKAISLHYTFEKKEIKNNWCLLKYSKTQ
jgi:hypothetical protein